MSTTYFTSDTHYNHKNICSSTSEWTNKKRCRQFPSLEAMNDALVDAINRVVQSNDVLWHLGDWSFGGINSIKEFRDRINCVNIHLVLGNHDHHMAKEEIAQLFSSVQHYKEIKVEGIEIVLMHYALRVWNRQAQGAWHLYGNSHGSLPRLNNYSIDVGVDGLSYEQLKSPYSIDELKEVFKNDTINPEDHHTRSSQTPPLGGRHG